MYEYALWINPEFIRNLNFKIRNVYAKFGACV